MFFSIKTTLMKTIFLHENMKFQHKKRKLKERDVISDLLILLIVGYDTTGMTRLSSSMPSPRILRFKRSCSRK